MYTVPHTPQYLQCMYTLHCCECAPCLLECRTLHKTTVLEFIKILIHIVLYPKVRFTFLYVVYFYVFSFYCAIHTLEAAAYWVARPSVPCVAGGKNKVKLLCTFLLLSSLSIFSDNLSQVHTFIIIQTITIKLTIQHVLEHVVITCPKGQCNYYTIKIFLKIFLKYCLLFTICTIGHVLGHVVITCLWATVTILSLKNIHYCLLIYKMYKHFTFSSLNHVSHL